MGGKYNSGGAIPTEMGQPIPRGEYAMEITQVLPGRSKASGTEMVTVTAKILDEAQRNRTIKHYVMFHPTGHQSVGMTLHFLKTIGEPWEGEFEWDETRWIGRRFMGTVEWEMFNGNPSHKIKRVRPMAEVITTQEEVPF